MRAESVWTPTDAETEANEMFASLLSEIGELLSTVAEAHGDVLEFAREIPETPNVPSHETATASIHTYFASVAEVADKLHRAVRLSPPGTEAPLDVSLPRMELENGTQAQELLRSFLAESQ
eukprot:GHVU01147355.1.p3 GENE.GHVU01147355.1~~GHVU01147355.1.p3  ORF type:complete len:121 (-),score=23.36 GHVU01147355.1:320-682(-)